MDRKLNILFRWSPHNHYSLSALFGCLDEKLPTEKFQLSTAENLKDIIEKTNAFNGVTVLGYSFTTIEFDGVTREIRQLKAQLGNRIIIIAGGSHASALPESVIEAGADVVFKGEAEESLPFFLQRLYESLDVLKEKIVESMPLNELDEYPPFAYKRGFYGPIELRRGCINTCSFCQTPRLFSGIKERSIASVLSYAKMLKKAKRMRILFTLSDALLYGAKGHTVNLGFIEEFLSAMHGLGLDILYGIFPSEISPRSLSKNPAAAALLRTYITNKKILLGAQSLSDRVLHLMQRDHTVADVEESIRLLCEQDFFPVIDILLGVPGEGHEDRAHTLEAMRALARKYPVHFNMHYCMPLPGSPLFGQKPEPLETDIQNTIHSLMDTGVVTGYFFKQVEFSRS